MGWSGGGGAGYGTVGQAADVDGGLAGTVYGNSNLLNFYAGSGGGGGSGGYDCGAGGGGAGGGIMILNASNISIGANGQVSSNGGNGGSDGTGNCGGGGAGSGGAIYMSAIDINVQGVVTANGGIGGASNISGNPYYGTGGNGGDGRIRIDYANYTGTGTVSPLPETSYTLLPGIESVTECFEYTWINGETYTESINDVHYVIPGGSQNGCDSVVVLNLSITEVDDLVMITNETLMAAQTGATYQWLDCDNNAEEIENATNASYTAIMNGNYAVEITMNGCTVTSDCYFIGSTGLDELNLMSQFQLMPNPTNGVFEIRFNGLELSGQVTILNLNGAIVHREFFGIDKQLHLEIPGRSGVYFVRLETEVGTHTYKVMKR